ncbi:hypothetical protein F4801DRAFT_387310 [Xylaria longipes]|nr:hypothetical protein F4801DRAFT_387310 [Xylaria longipes]
MSDQDAGTGTPSPPPLPPGVRLEEHEKEILKRQIYTPEPQMSRLGLLYTCATTFELLLLVISSIAAIIGGALQPVSFLLLRGLAQAFKEFFLGLSTGPYLSSLVARFALFYVYITIGQFVSVHISTAGFMITGEKITQRLREKYLAAILRQNIQFFDVLGAGEITKELLLIVRNFRNYFLLIWPTFRARHVLFGPR